MTAGGSSGWVLDTSRIAFGVDDRNQLERLLKDRSLGSAVLSLFEGATVNTTERQPALHMALRAADPSTWPGQDSDVSVLEQRDRFLGLADELHSGRSGLRDLIHVGMGGSDLGPRLLADALGDPASAVRVHFLSTLNHRRLEALLNRLDPATTGLVIASKSFSTEETLLQARAVKDWLGRHFQAQSWAATANRSRAQAFRIENDHVLSFPTWVGGRFSLWSSVGISAAAAMGREPFERLLAGAAAADRAFFQSSQAGEFVHLSHDLALLIHHLQRGLNLPTLGVVAYDPRLGLLGDYLQQLIMESLGKGVDLADEPLDEPAAPLVFGARGTDGQHALFQAFHQGLDHHPLILVGSLNDDTVDPDWQRTQLANLLGQ
ncbi:MAG: glucose-6-phosphate isomerase, partial [Pseudomonadota bacterium]